MQTERLPRLAQPRRRRNRSRRIVMLLVFFFVTLLAVLFFRSDLSKIDKIEITGHLHTTVEEIGQAIVIQPGDSFFAATANRLASRVEKLPAVDKAVVRKKFPGRIEIEVSEYPEAAYLLQPDGEMTAVLASGHVVPLIKGEPVRNLPVLSGWENHRELLDKLCRLLADIPAPLLADISQIKPEPTLSYPDRIRMYTRSRFEVITTVEYLPDKLDYMLAIIGSSQPGVITMLEANSIDPYHKTEERSEEQ